MKKHSKRSRKLNGKSDSILSPTSFSGPLSRNTKLRRDKVCVGVLAVMLVIWIIIFAATRELEYDEAYTYLHYARNFQLSYISYLFRSSLANNHWLNTIAIHGIQELTHSYYNDFMIRLPNVCMAIAYACVVLYLYHKSHICFITASLLLLNSTVVNWFSQARGNGIALACVLFAFLFYAKWVKADFQSDFLLEFSLASFALGTYAITTVIFILVVFSMVVIYKLWKEKRLFFFIKNHFTFLLLLAVSQLIIFEYSLNISAEGRPRPVADYGLFKSMFQNFVGTYISNNTVSFVLGILLALFLFSGVIMFRKKILSANYINTFMLYLVLLFILKALAKIDYPIPRLMIISIPLYLFAVQEVFLWFYEMIIVKIGQMPFRIASFIGTCVLLFVFTQIQISTVRYHKPNVETSVYTAALTGVPVDEPPEWPVFRYYCEKIKFLYGVDVPVV